MQKGELEAARYMDGRIGSDGIVVFDDHMSLTNDANTHGDKSHFRGMLHWWSLCHVDESTANDASTVVVVGYKDDRSGAQMQTSFHIGQMSRGK